MAHDQKHCSRVGKVLEALVTAIVEDRYSSGMPTQDDLSRQYGVSRPVMREALSMLRIRNMLDVRARFGTQVRPVHHWRMIDEDVVRWRFRAKPDRAFLRDILELRYLIEPRAAALAATRGDAADVTAIGTAFDVFRTIRPCEPGYQVAGELLCMRIIAASGNQFLQQMASIVRGTLPTVNLVVNRREDTWAASVRIYGRVVEAIERADPDEAAMASFALLDYMVGESDAARSVDRATEKAALSPESLSTC